MCGIAGIIGIELDQDRAEKSCLSMLNSIRHRGPDASGIFHDHPGRAHLIHARLSIIDLSERSNQPLHRHGRYSIVFNGEIYNYRSLRKDLESAGSDFQTESDTEVILALYEKEGSGAFKKLRGMYAFAIWDRQEGRCILARDPFGIKPLYYAQKGQGLLFASEVKPLLASGLVKTDLNPGGVAAYLQWGSADPENSLLQDILTLPPGFVLETSANHFCCTRFQSVEWESSLHDAGLADFRSAFLDSVSAHLVSDVPVGLFLSGGLDSSAILAACGILGKTDVRPLTLSFPGTATDESPVTRRIAAHFQKTLVVEGPSDEELPRLFSEFLKSQDLPSIDGFNTYCISRIARQQGIKVVLSGLGGDELLGSYPSFQRVPQWTAMGRLFSRIPGKKAITRSLHLFPGNRTARLSQFLAGRASAFDAYVANRSLFTRKEIKSLLSYLGLPRESVKEDLLLYPSSALSLNQVSQWEASLYMKNQLLRDSDACSMQHGIELRIPFVDLPLWSTSARLPDSLRYENGKKILQKALPELPDWLFTIPKKGFALPYDQWKRETLRDNFRTFPAACLDYSPTWYQQMALISLNHWQSSLSASS